MIPIHNPRLSPLEIYISVRKPGLLSSLVLALLSLTACNKSEPITATSSEATAAAESSSSGVVTLKPEEAEKLGIVTAPAQALKFTAEQAGYGVVLGHELIAQVAADVAVAAAAVRQSHAALARSQRLANTPGAFPAETQENAERQAAADDAALSLAQRKLTATLGEVPGWQDTGNKLIGELAGGQVKLLRVTFPLGTLSGDTPHLLRIARLDPAATNESWTTTNVWNAPADASMPGRSYFALLTRSGVSEGERLQVAAPSANAAAGVLVPAQAVVISDGKYWCYIAKQPGTFVRTALDTSKQVADGYFVKEGIAVGDAIVTAAAGLLLARELNPSTEAE